MTREEAIKVLNMVEAHGLAEEAKQMAIKALSQEPCDECRNKRTSFCGNCKEYDEYEPCDDAISREAVLDYLKSESDNFPDYHEAIEHVLELPSVTQKSTECVDAINREAAIKTVHKMRVVCDTEDIDDYYELLVESFKQLLSVTPSRRKGRWIWVGENSYGSRYMCDKCNHEQIGATDFCPNCGAKMESEE